jgi:hypothetical protein
VSFTHLARPRRAAALALGGAALVLLSACSTDSDPAIIGGRMKRLTVTYPWALAFWLVAAAAAAFLILAHALGHGGITLN